jgi:hypothetical protein
MRNGWVRGIGTLVVLGLVGAAMLGSSATAAKPSSKKFVKKQIRALSSNVIHQPLYLRRSEPVEVVNNDFDEAFVACPAGTVPTGGGVSPETNGTANYYDFTVHASHPSTGSSINAGTTGWSAGVTNNSVDPYSFRVYVICAQAQKDANFGENVAPGS